MKTTVKPDVRVMELMENCDKCNFDTPKAVEEFYKNWMELVWDYKVPGRLFDYYIPNIVVERENGDNINGIQALVQDVLVVQAAFPDVSIDVEAIVCIGSPEDGYDLFARRYLHGTSKGYSKFGPPTGQSLGENCMSLDMIRFEKVGAKWQIVYECLNQSIRTIREAMGGPYELA